MVVFHSAACVPGALVWLANQKPDAVDDDKQLLMLAIGDNTSGTLGSVSVGGGGNNVGGRARCRDFGAIAVLVNDHSARGQR
jgi:hypothetical protein